MIHRKLVLREDKSLRNEFLRNEFLKDLSLIDFSQQTDLTAKHIAWYKDGHIEELAGEEPYKDYSFDSSIMAVYKNIGIGGVGGMPETAIDEKTLIAMLFNEPLPVPEAGASLSVLPPTAGVSRAAVSPSAGVPSAGAAEPKGGIIRGIITVAAIAVFLYIGLLSSTYYYKNYTLKLEQMEMIDDALLSGYTIEEPGLIECIKGAFHTGVPDITHIQVMQFGVVGGIPAIFIIIVSMPGWIKSKNKSK